MIRHVFGPVASRRLGISLGVDIIPFKTCTLDCLYCECGRTTDLTGERKSFVDPRVILEEIKEVITRDPHIEYITFSGSGEPTLNKDIGKIISGIKAITAVPIAILTNGTLLHMEPVRKEIAGAHLVCPSLDAASPGTFAILNRPHQGLTIDTVINGLIDFRKTFKGEIWLEVFIAGGINDSDPELEKIYRAVKKIRPDKVQLNSLDRPPACDHLYPVDIDTLERIKKTWRDLPMPVEIIKRIHRREEIAAFNHNLENNILNTINRRPLTIDDLVTLTGKNRREIFKYIDVLEKEKKIYARIVGDKIFYAPGMKEL